MSIGNASTAAQMRTSRETRVRRALAPAAREEGRRCRRRGRRIRRGGYAAARRSVSAGPAAGAFFAGHDMVCRPPPGAKAQYIYKY